MQYHALFLLPLAAALPQGASVSTSATTYSPSYTMVPVSTISQTTVYEASASAVASGARTHSSASHSTSTKIVTATRHPKYSLSMSTVVLTRSHHSTPSVSVSVSVSTQTVTAQPSYAEPPDYADPNCGNCLKHPTDKWCCGKLNPKYAPPESHYSVKTVGQPVSQPSAQKSALSGLPWVDEFTKSVLSAYGTQTGGSNWKPLGSMMNAWPPKPTLESHTSMQTVTLTGTSSSKHHKSTSKTTVTVPPSSSSSSSSKRHRGPGSHKSTSKTTVTVSPSSSSSPLAKRDDNVSPPKMPWMHKSKSQSDKISTITETASPSPSDPVTSTTTEYAITRTSTVWKDDDATHVTTKTADVATYTTVTKTDGGLVTIARPVIVYGTERPQLKTGLPIDGTNGVPPVIQSIPHATSASTHVPYFMSVMYPSAWSSIVHKSHSHSGPKATSKVDIKSLLTHLDSDAWWEAIHPGVGFVSTVSNVARAPTPTSPSNSDPITKTVTDFVAATPTTVWITSSVPDAEQISYVEKTLPPTTVTFTEFDDSHVMSHTTTTTHTGTYTISARPASTMTETVNFTYPASR